MTSVFKAFNLQQKEDGDIGVEIEVEGINLPNMKSYWRNERDGSLAGAENREYVLAKPMTLDGVKKALRYMEGQFERYQTTIDDAVRAGVHIHINCQQLTLTELYNFITCFLLLENLLVKWCGKTREGNLFCLRGKDASYLISRLISAIKDKRRILGLLHSDQLRYAALNVKALGDYGSLEFRSMRSTRDLGKIEQWATILLNLRESAKKFANPQEIIQKFSMEGPATFAKGLLGDFWESVSDLYKSKDEMNKDLYEGMRMAQDVAYGVDSWEKWDSKLRKIGDLEFEQDDEPDEPEEDF